jgi:transposase
LSFIRRIKKGKNIYLAEVENKWINGKCVQKHLRYIGREADGKTLLSVSISEVEVDEVKAFGPLLVLNYLARQLDLHELLGRYWKEILSMVFAHCMDYQSISQMEHWFERTDLGMMLDLSGVTEKRLLCALDSLESMDQAALQKRIFERTRSTYRVSLSGVFYDVTNTYLYGKKCPFGKPGHDKDGAKGRPLIQIGLGVSKDRGFPLFHKVFDGNIHDARTLQDLISEMKSYQVKSSLFVFDRGISSAKNISDIKKLRCHVLCGLPLRQGLKSKVKKLIAHNEFISLENRVSLNKTIFYVLDMSYEIQGVKGTLAVCFNEQQRKDLRESRYDELLNAQPLVKKGKPIKRGLGKFFSKSGTIKKSVVAESEEFDGYSCIFCTKSLSKQEMVVLYFDKDLVEKAFRTIKGITRLQPIRHWLYNRVKAHVFICYLSYLLLSSLRSHLGKLCISPETALKELSTMYKVYMRDSKNRFKLSRVVTMSKRQEEILKAVSPKLLKPSV